MQNKCLNIIANAVIVCAHETASPGATRAELTLHEQLIPIPRTKCTRSTDEQKPPAEVLGAIARQVKEITTGRPTNRADHKKSKFTWGNILVSLNEMMIQLRMDASDSSISHSREMVFGKCGWHDIAASAVQLVFNLENWSGAYHQQTSKIEFHVCSGIGQCYMIPMRL